MSYLIFWIFNILLFSQSTHCDEFKDLTQNFFDNLEINLEDGISLDDSIAFTDKQVQNFVDLIKRRHHNFDERTKRQVVETVDSGNYAIHLLEGITPISNIPVKNPKDIILFQHQYNESLWYAAAIEKSDKLKIFKFNGQVFEQIQQQKVNAAIKLGFFTTKKQGTFIILAENATKESFNEKTSVYLFTPEEKLQQVQNLHLDYASDVAIWDNKGDVFLAIAQQFTKVGEKLNCQAKSTVYKWLGGHFDIIQHINTTCAIKVTPFAIGKDRFLAFANHLDRNGNSDTYSEIFKFDLSKEAFVSHQKIATRGASDIKFFAFRNSERNSKIQENFIVVANTYTKDDGDDIDYNVKSIIYKFVEGFFLPFQSFDLVGVTEWLPSIGPQGEFALFAACKFEGIKTFQYNGWKFHPTPNQYTQQALSTGIQSMHSYIFNNKQIIIVSNQNNINTNFNVFQLNFKFQNQVEKHYNNLLGWCRHSIQEIQTNQNSKAKRSADVKGLREVEEDLSNDKNTENNLSFVELQLETQQQQIDSIEKKLNGTQEELTVFPSDIVVRNLVINNEVFFNDLVAITLNDMNIVNFLTGIVPIDNTPQFNIRTLTLSSATIENLIGEPKLLNGNLPENLMHSNIDNLEISKFVINGNLLVTNLQVKETLNNLKFNSTNVLLKEGNQFFNGNLNVEEIKVNNVTSRFLNNLNLQNSQPKTKTITISEVDTLRVKHLTIGGYLNNVDLPTLNKYALKTKGNQIVTSDYLFDELVFNNLETNLLNGYSVPEDFVLTTKGEYFIHQDVQFEQPLEAKKLYVTHNLNNILIKEDGTIDVLFKNSSQMQFINGKKILNELELMKPMKLQGNINSDSMQELNPVTKISEILELVGDYTIRGNVTIESQLETTDIQSGEYSIQNLKENGLKLNAEEIDVHLNFAQQLNIDEIFADRINEINTRQWVVNGNNITQYIKGWKTFKGDLHVTGNTNLNIVNQIPLQDVAENVMKIDGNQIITGKHEFQNVIAGSITSPHISLQSRQPLEAILTNNIEQVITNAFIEELSVDKLQADNVRINGIFNGIHFVNMLEDTLFKGENTKVVGSKSFENITIENLISRKSINMNRIPTLIKRGEATTGDATVLELPDDIQIENIKFKNILNNMSVEDFAENWLTGTEQIISGDQVFNKVVVYGNLQVDTNKINDLYFKHLVEDTVKTTEDHDFHTVKFEQDVTSLKAIQLQGHIENLDIDNIVADDGEEIFAESLSFKESVTIFTPTELDGTINGFNFSDLCAFAEPRINEDNKSLIIEGNGIIMKAPIVKTLNNKDVQDLITNVWYNDVPANVTDLQAHHVNFHEDVIVDGVVAGTNLKWLENNYFSKTKNQTIPSNINFQEGLTINGNLIAPQAIVQGTVNEVNLDEFVRTAILQNWNQTFEEVLFAECIILNNIEGDYFVNGMNLRTDVMRYDAENIVTGKISVNDLDVGELNPERNFKVQDVDLKLWTQTAILKRGSFMAEGRLVFRNFTVFEKGVSLTGLLNQKVFTEEKVLLKSKPQSISGKKIFMVNPFKVQNMKLKGTINDIDFADLVQNQALKSENTTFTNPIDFHNSILVQNVNFDGLFQGVNVSDLITNLTKSAFVENYYENYDRLLDASRAVQKSLKSQANYLNYFRTMQSFHRLVDLVPIKNIQGTLHLAALRVHNEGLIVDFLKWSHNPDIFIIDSTMKQIKFQNVVIRLSPLEYHFGSYLYVEMNALDQNRNTRLGKVLNHQNASNYEIIAEIPNNGTKQVLPIFLPKIQKTCLLLVHNYNNHMDIHCQGEHSMELHQALTIINPLQVLITSHNDRLEIIAIEKNHQHSNERKNHPAVIIWVYDENTELFNEKQRIYSSTPLSISAINHEKNQFLAIANGHLMNTMYPGQIDIYKYDPIMMNYYQWQTLRANAPLEVHLSVLPSNELILYILRNSPTEMLYVYEYTGIGKFTAKGTVALQETCRSMQPITHVTNNSSQHFILAKCNDEVNVIQSIFKNSL